MTELNNDARQRNAEGQSRAPQWPRISNISDYKAYLNWFHDNISGSISTFKEQMAKANLLADKAKL